MLCSTMAGYWLDIPPGRRLRKSLSNDGMHPQFLARLSFDDKRKTKGKFPGIGNSKSYQMVDSSFDRTQKTEREEIIGPKELIDIEPMSRKQ